MRSDNNNSATTAFAAAPGQAPVCINVNDCHRTKTTSLVVVCGAMLTIAIGNGAGVASAFSPACRQSPPMTTIHRSTRMPFSASSTSPRRTRLHYKHHDLEDGKNNETVTVLSEQQKSFFNVKVDVDVSVEIKKDVIFYNDLDDDNNAAMNISSKNYDVSFSSSNNEASNDNVDSSDNNASSNDLIHELKDVINRKKINPFVSTSKPKAIEPSIFKPAKKFISPIQMIKKVPKVEPISMSTVFFLKLMGDPMWPGEVSRTKKQNSPPRGEKKKKKKQDDNKEKTKPAVEDWTTQMEKRNTKSNAFRATSYLDSLGAEAKDKSTNENEANSKDMLKSLRDQQAALRNEQAQSQQQAIYDATRRTSPKEAAAERMAKEQEERERKEDEKLEMLYAERRERLDAKKRLEREYLEETAREREFLEEKARERNEAAVVEEKGSSGSEKTKKKPLTRSRNGKRGIPILDRPSFAKASPLLVGSTLTFQYSDLTPFQRRSIEVAQWHHEEHCERMTFDGADSREDEYCSLTTADDEGGIQAAPIIALIDSYTIEGKLKKRFATLAAIELMYDSDSGKPSVVNLMGVGRVYLHDYFSSNDTLMSGEEEELSQLLSKMQDTDREHELYDEDTAVVMAEFDLLLDDSSVLSNDSEASKYEEAELYQSANKVYRLHEERKKLVAGLRAGDARLRLGKEREIDENCLVEFEDCDGLDIIGGMMDDPMGEEEETSTPSSKDIKPRSRLETLNNYGLGSFGILSTVPDLTVQLMSCLEPYYSLSHREREEYEAEVASMIAFQTLEEYASPEEVAAALLAPSATQRLEMAYGIMIRHRDELYELVEMISQELGECGEGSTDI